MVDVADALERTHTPFEISKIGGLGKILIATSIFSLHEPFAQLFQKVFEQRVLQSCAKVCGPGLDKTWG
jgi:hypothetical protein